MRRRLASNAILILVACFSLGISACGDDDPDTRPPATDYAALGEQAFYDTMFGLADRRDETVDLLAAAVRVNPQDGHSWFHLGMMRIFRFSQSVQDYHNVTAAERNDAIEARMALDRAVPLVPEDRRIPGFQAAALYTEGVVTNDLARQQLGLQHMRAAIALYPEFNNFDFIGTVGAIVPPSDPLYDEVLQYVGNPLDLNGACTPFNQPEICGNFGKAAHNVEGAMVLFGDLFAKAGNKAKALGFYRLAAADFASPGGPWRFSSLIEERITGVDQRIAAYKDADPTNDPFILGYRGEACAVCHYR